MNPGPSFMLAGSFLLAIASVAGCSTASSAPPAPASPAPASSTAVSSAPASAPLDASPNPVDTASTALTETFTSPIHGISVSYPAGWTISAATQAAAASEGGFLDPSGDFIYDASLPGHLFLALRSEPLGSSSADAWIADQAETEECARTEPVIIDGAAGAVGIDCNLALVSAGGRGYAIRLYLSDDDDWLDDVYDRAWFEKVLAAVDLRPQDALDVPPSATP